MHTGPVSGFTHIWASTYRGRRWLLFARELALLPPHVLRFRRTLRRNQLRARPLQRLAADPGGVARAARGAAGRLAPALGAAGRRPRPALARSSAPRSGGSRRRRSRSTTTSRDVFGVGSTVVPNSVDLERFQPGDASAAKAALGLRPTGRSSRTSASSTRRRASASSSRRRRGCATAASTRAT